jgi:F0F1-type ATP synthase assembly protein I
MNKSVKIALIGVLVLGLGVGAYFLIKKSKKKTGNDQKNKRKIVIK